jgi:hypothetical protein
MILNFLNLEKGQQFLFDSKDWVSGEFGLYSGYDMLSNPISPDPDVQKGHKDNYYK